MPTTDTPRLETAAPRATASSRHSRSANAIVLVALLGGLMGCADASRSSADTVPAGAATTVAATAPTTAPATSTSTVLGTAGAACPSAPENPLQTAQQISVAAASLPMRDGWTVRGTSPGWVAFGPGSTEAQGGNLLLPTCAMTPEGLVEEVPADVVAWLLDRKDLDAKVVEELSVDGQRGVLVTVGQGHLLWCLGSSSADCFGSNRAYGVFPTSKGVVVVEGFGADERQVIDNTRSLASELDFG